MPSKPCIPGMRTTFSQMNRGGSALTLWMWVGVPRGFIQIAKENHVIVDL